MFKRGKKNHVNHHSNKQKKSSQKVEPLETKSPIQQKKIPPKNNKKKLRCMVMLTRVERGMKIIERKFNKKIVFYKMFLEYVKKGKCGSFFGYSGIKKSSLEQNSIL